MDVRLWSVHLGPTTMETEVVDVWHRRAIVDVAGGRDPVDVLAERLIADAEALLAGRLALRWAEQGRLVPGWAWIGALAHADPSEIRSLHRRPAGATATRPGWGDALCFIADALCAIADTGGPSIDDVQRRVLVPLELTAMPMALTPEQAVSLFVVGLQRSGVA